MLWRMLVRLLHCLIFHAIIVNSYEKIKNKPPSTSSPSPLTRFRLMLFLFLFFRLSNALLNNNNKRKGRNSKSDAQLFHLHIIFSSLMQKCMSVTIRFECKAVPKKTKIHVNLFWIDRPNETEWKWKPRTTTRELNRTHKCFKFHHDQQVELFEDGKHASPMTKGAQTWLRNDACTNQHARHRKIKEGWPCGRSEVKTKTGREVILTIPATDHINAVLVQHSSMLQRKSGMSTPACHAFSWTSYIST